MLIILANKIFNMMNGNLSVPVPDPPLLSLQTLTTNYSNSKVALETAKTNLKLTAADEKAKRKLLELGLTGEARYVDSRAAGDKTIIESCGMEASNQPSPVHLGQVEDLSLTRGDNPGSVDAHWHAIIEGNGYTVQTSTVAPDATGHAPWAFYSNSTKSSITIAGLTSGSNIWVHACANGSANSSGAYSDPAMLIVP
jgi:hypothetical protein